MPEFTVSEVVDGDTFRVKGGWKWDSKIRRKVFCISLDVGEAPNIFVAF